jgi:acetoacetyl-CoA synthetase
MTEEAPPTLAALAALLGQGPRGRVPPLVLLKAENKSLPTLSVPISNSPIFVAHGLGDTVMGLLQLASHLQVSNPIYGMQARGLDGLDEPLDRIEDMAEFHLRAIRQLQPHGPYMLVGYSLGGLVTFEIARHLCRDGEKIALLAMLDSYPHRTRLPTRQHARLLLRLAKERAASFIHLRGHDLRSQVGEGSNASASDQPPLDEGAALALQRVKEYQGRAWRKYRPRFYEGKISFVKAAISSFLPENPTAVWAPLATQIEIVTVPGNHGEMLTTQAGSLASVLSHFLGAVGGLGVRISF